MTSSVPEGALALTGPDRLIAGRYEVLGEVAHGGEATVYRARDLELGLDVVVKTRPLINIEDLERLRREASMLMQLVGHRGLPIVRSDLVEDGLYHLISDYVEGTDLHTTVAAQSDHRLTLRHVLDIVEQLAETLDHLHGHRPPVIHGDVKPENVILTADGRVVLVDFGAAMRIGDDRERIGSPGYSAPELLAGEALTPATDVYSLTALAVFLLTGIVPKLGAAWPAALGGGELARLERILRRGLTWDPLGRPWSASEFASRLREAAEMDIPTGTVTLVMIEVPNEAMRTSPAVLLLEAAGGRLAESVTLPGDLALFVFPRAGDAASAVLEIAEPNAPAVVMHAGDLGGWNGATLQQLADESIALHQTAPRATITCSPPVSMLLGGDQRLAFTPAGIGLTLRDVSAVQLDRQTRSDDESADRAGQWIATRRARPLAGRESELALARDAVETGRAAGESPLVLVLGAAGMGKTRLLAELAGLATESGEHVLVGRCSESGGAFEPFIDALGDDAFPFESSHVERDEEGWTDRRRFFRNIADTLRAAAPRVTLVIDDIQWIDGTSMALLTQLQHDLAGVLSVYSGCRPVAARSVLDTLSAQPGARVVSVGALQPAELATLATSSGLHLDDRTVQSLHALTGGNPFFGLQLLHHLREAPDRSLMDSDLPAGVRDWILDRVDRVSDGARATLAVAAVIGRSFEVIPVSDVLGVSPLEALSDLEASVTSGLVIEGAHPGEFRFVHAIVRTTLEESLSASRLAMLHASVAQRLEESNADLDHLEAVLHHWLEAGRLGDPLHACELAVEVAARSTERLAHERAVTVLDRAIPLLTDAPATVERDRVEARMRVAYGRAGFFDAEFDQAIDHLYRAADLAEGADDPATLAEAALVASLHRRHGLDDPELLRLLERATDRCPPEPAVLPAMLHVRRARLLPGSVPHEDRCAIARRGLADLDSMDDVDRATVETEVARACWSPDDAADRMALTTRHIEAADQHVASGGPSRWTGVLVEALNHRSAARVQLGDIHGALADADRAAQLADDAGTTFLLTRVMMGQAMIHGIRGDHDTAERLSHDAVAMSDRHNLVLIQMALTYSIGRDRGEQLALAGLEQQFHEFVDQNPLFVAAFALVHAEADQLDDARRLLDKLRASAPWPRNWLWLATTVAALETSVLVGDADMARRYAAILTRYRGQWALAGAELACWGPVDRVLGLAHLAAGRMSDGRDALLAARAASVAQEAAPWVERCDRALAVVDDTST